MEEIAVTRDASAAQQTLIDTHFQAHSAAWRDVYEQKNVEGEIYRRRLQIVLEWIDNLSIPIGEKALEVGCGSGRATVALAQRGYVVDAIDSTPNMLAITRQYAAGAGVARLISANVGNACLLDFADHSFGIVLAVGVMPYLTSPRKALAEMARVLKPGGFLLLTAGNRWRLNHILDPWLCPPLQPARRFFARILRPFRKLRPEPFRPSLRFESGTEFDASLAAAGFVTLKRTTVGFQPLTFRQRLILREETSIRLNRALQSLADRNVPGIRSMGMDHVFLARKGALG
jgi:ubiquinone/menaquinone biosynthesis C-methylase UbiE